MKLSVKSILDCTVLVEVRSLVRLLLRVLGPPTWWSCVFPEALDEDVGELRGGMKAASTSSQVHSPAQPGQPGSHLERPLSSVASAGWHLSSPIRALRVMRHLPSSPEWAEACEPGRQETRPGLESPLTAVSVSILFRTLFLSFETDSHVGGDFVAPKTT